MTPVPEPNIDSSEGDTVSANFAKRILQCHCHGNWVEQRTLVAEVTQLYPDGLHNDTLHEFAAVPYKGIEYPTTIVGT
jgi:hypothetical protein